MLEDEHIKEYVEQKLAEVGYEKAPCGYVYKREEFEELIDFSKNDRVMAIFYALSIGFANGVRCERKNNKNRS